MTRGRPSSRFAARGREGFALIVVLLVVALLEVLVADLAAYAWLATQEARNFSRDAQHMAGVDGVLRVTQGLLFQSDLAPEQRALILQEGVRDAALGGAAMDVLVEDESAKLNLNLLADADPAAAQGARKEFSALCAAMGMAPTFAEQVARFMAGDPASSETPATPRRLTILEELRGVGGASDGFSAGGAAAAATNPLAAFVTCHGDGRLNANTASKEVLQAVFADVASALPELILQGRSVRPFASLEEIENLTPLSEDAQARLRDRLATESEAYQVTVVTRAGESLQVSRAILERGPDGAAVVRLCRRGR